jgi:cation diffusion facilitator family transporter
LLVNVASVLLLSGSGHHHHHGHGHGDDQHGDHHDDARRIDTDAGLVALEIFEHGVPPRFRLSFEGGFRPAAHGVTVETVRPGGARQVFTFEDRGGHLESVEEIPEPHAFEAHLRLDRGAEPHSLAFEEHGHEHAQGAAHRDNNMRAAVIHVLADAAVSVLVITGLLLGRFFGWVWMDPAAGMCGAVVIAAWSYGLVRDTGAILLDMNPDWAMAERMRALIETDGDTLRDLHLWRLGPGHLGAILSITTSQQRGPDHYRRMLDRFRTLSHVTVEIEAR